MFGFSLRHVICLGKRYIWLQHSVTLPKAVTDSCNKWICTDLTLGTLISILIALSHAFLWSCVRFVLIPIAELGCIHSFYVYSLIPTALPPPPLVASCGKWDLFFFFCKWNFNSPTMDWTQDSCKWKCRFLTPESPGKSLFIDLPCARPYSTHWGLSSEQNRQKSLPHSGSIAHAPISLTVGLERESQISGFSL